MKALMIFCNYLCMCVCVCAHALHISRRQMTKGKSTRQSKRYDIRLGARRNWVRGKSIKRRNGLCYMSTYIQALPRATFIFSKNTFGSFSFLYVR